jgi:DNA helicase II / ATP-dependent DNA helicase PcrA
MIRLNPEQQDAVDYDGNVVVTACPGSGKTRVLTARVIRGLQELQSSRERVVALTFTNRAADEIQVRLDKEGIPTDHLWTGTIHSFALEWVLRPYAPYCGITKLGFSVADEFRSDQLLADLKEEYGLESFAEISTAYTRAGASLNEDDLLCEIFEQYKVRLHKRKLIDYDDILYLAYEILAKNPEIAATIGSIVRVVCVDEVQDVQDLHFAILAEIAKASAPPVRLFFVGDSNQSIYESLGALTKCPEEIADEFGLDRIGSLPLCGNYRSTQRIIDLYRQFRPKVPYIESRTEYSDLPGEITFHDQTVSNDDLPGVIAGRITASIDAGAALNDICVLAPQWWHVRSIARCLVAQLPGIEFDAPGLSPLYGTRDNFWFKVARLFLTSPSPSRVWTRLRWAKEVLSELSALADSSVPSVVETPRRLLRAMNAISSVQTEGIPFLRDVFSQFLGLVGIDLELNYPLSESFDTFFQRAEARVAAPDGGCSTELSSFRRLFSHPSGVVVSTCHGVKGEEYDTVIAFGLLKGYVPHWDVIINGTEEMARERESKLLYVISSRAKRRLHLIAESGRETRRGNPYETSMLLRQVRFKYDET